MQTIIPYLAYEDAPAALTFLRDAFGFEERFRLAMKDGRIGHAEVASCRGRFRYDCANIFHVVPQT